MLQVEMFLMKIAKAFEIKKTHRNVKNGQKQQK